MPSLLLVFKIGDIITKFTFELDISIYSLAVKKFVVVKEYDNSSLYAVMIMQSQNEINEDDPRWKAWRKSADEEEEEDNSMKKMEKNHYKNMKCLCCKEIGHDIS